MITKQNILDLNPCQESIEWLDNYDDMEVAWNECQRGDWLLWLIAKTTTDDRKLTLAKSRCANLVLHLMKDERSVNAVRMAEKYGLGEVTKEELGAARAAAVDAAADAAYAYYASDAAYAYYAAAVAYAYGDDAAAARAAAVDAAAAYYAAYYAASDAASDAAQDAAVAAAQKEILAKCADIVRKIYTFNDTTKK